ncbi:LysR family transcriptional regulator [Cupriavidus consociatus]|uniref:LysR family transcriptional regulator n=1 Tax=Cupriavidus consociatus TaxID=2821357 RepID=UPI001AE22714|nr:MULTISPECIES: LysR family transcriptional regulator [unclassified Cupriavidus]MBP0623364.1 LysR family transcriptional regulator [Cupriavidus sp. LEh25]MDK2660061.1 LysR family transcriptional regulator [Cupriavidus sp. LEh21]
MQSRSLRAFLALHQYGTIAAAADAVHLSPAAVSVQLKNLEDELALELFVRTGRSISLNVNGYRLVPLAQQMLDLQARMTSLNASHSLRGKLSLGVITSTLTGSLPDVLKRLSAEYPDLETRITADKSPELVSQVEAGLLDAAIVTCPPTYAPTSLRLHDLYAEPLALVQCATKPFGGIAHVLESSPYIAFERGSWVGRQIEAFLDSHRIVVRPAMELDSHDAVLSVVRHGIGVSILPMLHGRDWDFGGLRFVELPGVHRKVCLAVRAGNNDSKVTEVLLAYFREFGARCFPCR